MNQVRKSELKQNFGKESLIFYYTIMSTYKNNYYFNSNSKDIFEKHYRYFLIYLKQNTRKMSLIKSFFEYHSKLIFQQENKTECKFEDEFSEFLKLY
jgi:hypothetical protein